MQKFIFTFCILFLRTTTPAILDKSDYERVIEKGRAKIYYFPSAVEKIKEKRGQS